MDGAFQEITFQLLTGDLEGARRTLPKIKDFTKRDEDGSTLLHLALMARDEELAQAMVEAGVSIDDPDAEGKTPLMWAISERLFEFAKELVNRGAKVNAVDQFKRNVIHYAALTVTEVSQIEFLIHPELINAQDKDGNTPLHLAGRARNTAAICALLERDASLDIQNKSGLPSESGYEVQRAIKALKEQRRAKELEKKWLAARAEVARPIAGFAMAENLPILKETFQKKGFTCSKDEEDALGVPGLAFLKDGQTIDDGVTAWTVRHQDVGTLALPSGQMAIDYVAPLRCGIANPIDLAVPPGVYSVVATFAESKEKDNTITKWLRVVTILFGAAEPVSWHSASKNSKDPEIEFNDYNGMTWCLCDKSFVPKKKQNFKDLDPDLVNKLNDEWYPKSESPEVRIFGEVEEALVVPAGDVPAVLAYWGVSEEGRCTALSIHVHG